MSDDNERCETCGYFSRDKYAPGSGYCGVQLPPHVAAAVRHVLGESEMYSRNTDASDSCALWRAQQ